MAATKNTYIVLDSDKNILCACASPTVAFGEVVDMLTDLPIADQKKANLSVELSDGTMRNLNAADFGSIARNGKNKRVFRLWTEEEATELTDARATVVRMTRAATLLGLEVADLPALVAASAKVEAIEKAAAESDEDDNSFRIVAIPVTTRAYNS
tara:strand:- start:223 stop:687 length:465 start_codon:yes stop_codon:yes gene_type:complete